MSKPHSNVTATTAAGRPGLLARLHAVPLYQRIAAAVVCGFLLGFLLRPLSGWIDRLFTPLAGEDEFVNSLPVLIALFEIPGKMVLRVLGALAPPLVLLAVVRALMHAELGKDSKRLVRLLVLNTLVAISVGLLVANVVRPGSWGEIAAPAPPEQAAAHQGPLWQLLDNVPKSLLGPLSDDGKVLAVIFLAITFGMALRRLRAEPVQNVDQLTDVVMRALVIVLHWILEVVPLAVLGIVSAIIAREGVDKLLGMGAFVLSVLLALGLQTTYYLLRVRFGTWVRPRDLVRGCRDALLMAFSTGSSTATMPVTYACLKDRVGLREQSASMGALVGSNFNNDGTALYEAMAALFIAQAIGEHLSIGQQIMVVLTSIVASVGAAGIPEAGLVTMTLVFDAVGLPKSYIALLLTVDWFLDRCRTTINVMGDMNVSCMLDGRTRQSYDSTGDGSGNARPQDKDHAHTELPAQPAVAAV